MRMRNTIDQLATVKPVRSALLHTQATTGSTFDFFERSQLIIFNELQKYRSA